MATDGIMSYVCDEVNEMAVHLELASYECSHDIIGRARDLSSPWGRPSIFMADT